MTCTFPRLPPCLAAACLVCMSATGATAQSPVAIGSEFQVNTYTTSYQQNPVVAVARPGSAGGRFVVAWESEGSFADDGGPFGLQAQVLDRKDESLGSEFDVNSAADSGQGSVDAAMASSGGGVMVWTSLHSDGTDSFGSSIQGRLFDADGLPVAADFQVNTFTDWNQDRPSVAIRPEGDFVVVWQNGASTAEDPGAGIRGQRFDAAGQKLGGEFQVNSHTELYQQRPQVAMAHGGQFVVVWSSDSSPGDDDSGTSVIGRRFDADAQPLGDDFQVNTLTASSQYDPSIAASPAGDFVVAWTSSSSTGTDGDAFSVQARRFGADGTGLGDDLQVNLTTAGSQRTPAVAMARSRDFLVVFQSDTSSGDDDSGGAVVGRWFDGGGEGLGDEFQVNTYTTGLQRSPDVAVAPNGDFVVVWESEGSAGSDQDLSSIHAQRFAGRVLADGFEDGTLVLWGDP